MTSLIPSFHSGWCGGDGLSSWTLAVCAATPSAESSPPTPTFRHLLAVDPSTITWDPQSPPAATMVDQGHVVALGQPWCLRESGD